jgi:hypothetical protein
VGVWVYCTVYLSISVRFYAHKIRSQTIWAPFSLSLIYAGVSLPANLHPVGLACPNATFMWPVLFFVDENWSWFSLSLIYEYVSRLLFQYLRKTYMAELYKSLLCGTLPQSATRPLKTYSTAVRAIPYSACRQGPLSGNRTKSKKGSNAQQFYSANSWRWHKMRKAVEAWKQKRSAYYDMYITILLTHYGIYFWHELAYTFPHF